MKAHAYEKYLRVSPTKVLRYSRELKRGMSVNEAIAKLNFVPAKGAKFLKKAIESAKANLIFKATESKNEYDEEKFVIEKILIQKAQTFKRLRPRGRGRADIIQRRNTHIYVEINDGNVEE